MTDIYIPTTDKELSVKKAEEFKRYTDYIQWGRRNPVKFAEHTFGTQLLDFQRYAFHSTWYARFALWLCCRAWGKDTTASIYSMARMLLVPYTTLYVNSNSYAQSYETFEKLRKIALKQIPSFKNLTNIFADEVDKHDGASTTGFIQAPTAKFELFNHSKLEVLSSNYDANRGRRGGVIQNEVGWLSAESLAVIDNFANVDSEFSTSTDKFAKKSPDTLPLQIMYMSSASDVESEFFNKYKNFYKQMLAGNQDYFVFDYNAHNILGFSTINGEKLEKPHISKAMIDKAYQEDPDKAEREMGNKFSTGAGANAVVSMDDIIKNSTTRVPEFYGNGKDKYVLTYDPARAFDGSVCHVFKRCEDDDKGIWYQLVNSVSFVDIDSKNKTPMTMPEQVKRLREMILAYNGRASEYDNVEVYIDAGSGGGGISAVADSLLMDWTDDSGVKHKGIIDAVHPQYESARRKYPNAVPVVHLLEPTKYKRVIYDATQKMIRQGLIQFTLYDTGKTELLIEDFDKQGNSAGFHSVALTKDECIALSNVEITKTEMSYMCRTETANGGVTYSLTPEKKNNMHDDRAYALAMGCYALSEERRNAIVENVHDVFDWSNAPTFVGSVSF